MRLSCGEFVLETGGLASHCREALSPPGHYGLLHLPVSLEVVVGL